MSVRVVAEIARDLRERLPEWMGVVADRYGMPLPRVPHVFDWWQVATDEAPTTKQYPAVHVRHAGARLALRQAHEGVHDSTHSIVLEYEHLSLDRDEIAAAMTFAVEAFVRYLDTYPLGSRQLGRLVQKIAAPAGENIRLQHDPVILREIVQTGAAEIVQYRWGMTLTFDVDVRDTTWSDTP